MKIKNIILVFLLGLLGFSNIAAQEILSINDSLRFENVINDKEGLRSLSNDMGSTLALKAQVRLGYLMFRDKDYEGAKKELSSIRSLRADTKETREAAYFLGRIASIEKKPEVSRALYEEYLAKEPKGKWREGASYFLIKDMVKAKDKNVLARMKAHLNEFPVDSTYTKHVQYQLVQYYKKGEDYLNAAKEAEVLVAKYPKSEYSEDMNYQIGGFYYKAGRSDMAKSHFNKIIGNNPRGTEPNAIGQYLLAKVYDDDGDYKAARAEYKKVKENNPNIANWSAVGDYNYALSYYSEYAASPDSAKRALAEEALIKHIETYPQDKRTPRAMMTLAGLYSDNGEYEKALGVYASIEAFDSGSMANVAKGHEDVSLTAHNELLCQAKMMKANLLRNELARYEEAIKTYDEALALSPALHEAELGKAFSLFELMRWEEAKTIFEKAVKENWEEKLVAEEALKQITPKADTTEEQGNEIF